MNPELTAKTLARLTQIIPTPYMDEALITDSLPALIVAYVREQNRRTSQGTHWDGCWREHLDCAVVKVAEMQKRIAELEAGINAVSNLIRESGGVYGLHMNGDRSPWSEMLTGGRFEEWLLAFDEALKGGAE